MLHALIMAGGGGTRFWPRSRQKRPKQFLALAGAESLLQQAQARIEATIPPERTWVITAAEHVEETSRQLPMLPKDRIIGEPMGRDTAACIALGACLMQREDPNAIQVVMPADHVIEPTASFQQTIHVANHLVLEQPTAFVTIGIPPTFPATGYGYIERGAEFDRRQGIPISRVASFREKPHADLAEEFLASGRYYWNGGIFIWRASTILDAIQTNQPILAEAVARIAAAWSTSRRLEVLASEYPNLPRISIDYAVMEKAREVLVIAAPFRWDDVGSWLALERMHPQDAQNNTILANHLGIDTHQCVIVADPDIFVGTVGVHDLIIVQDGNALLVAHRSQETGIKKLVEMLQKAKRTSVL